MAGKRKKPEAPTEEGAPAWMNTYGDMVTLILTFFVLLFSFSTIDAKKWQKLVDSFKDEDFVAVASASEAGGEGIGGDDAIIVKQPEPEEEYASTNNFNTNVTTEFNRLFEEIKKHIEVNHLDTVLNVEKKGEVITLRITDSALFDSGKDKIKPNALVVLDHLTIIIREYESAIGMIRIEGHTDNVPISTSKFGSNWDLSVSRAVNVLQYLLKNSGITPARFSAVGYGEFQPIASNDTEEGKAKNRRVDFIIESVLKINAK
ncbi:MAG: OmpA/MotB family protein [Christensenellales bacterium]